MSSTIKKVPRHKYFVSLAALLGVLLGLGGVEVAARVLGLAPTLPNAFSFVPDSVLPWKLRPNKHNALGFRGRNYEIKKEPGVFRIVGIGDSFTYGAGVSDDATYLARIEATLLERGRGGVEVINLGVPRYWPEPEALMLEHYGLRYQPDLVIVGVLPNDFIDTRLGAAHASVSDGYLVTSRARRLGAFGMWLYRTSHVSSLHRRGNGRRFAANQA